MDPIVKYVENKGCRQTSYLTTCNTFEEILEEIRSEELQLAIWFSDNDFWDHVHKNIAHADTWTSEMFNKDYLRAIGDFFIRNWPSTIGTLDYVGEKLR